MKAEAERTKKTTGMRQSRGVGNKILRSVVKEVGPKSVAELRRGERKERLSARSRKKHKQTFG